MCMKEHMVAESVHNNNNNIKDIHKNNERDSFDRIIIITTITMKMIEIFTITPNSTLNFKAEKVIRNDSPFGPLFCLTFNGETHSLVLLFFFFCLLFIVM